MDKESNKLAIEQADRLFAEGEKIFQQNKYGEYKEQFEAAATIYLQLKNWREYVDCQYRLGWWYYRRGDLTTALNMSDENLRLFAEKMITDDLLKANMHYFSFAINFDLVKYEVAKKHIQKALELYESVGDKGGVASALMGMGNYYMHTYNYFKSLTYHFKSLKIIRENPKDIDCSYNYFNIAYAYYVSRQYSLAKSYFLHTLHMIKKYYGEDYPLIMSINSMLGEIALRKEQFDTAYFHLQKGIAFQERNNVRHYDVANLYLTMGKYHVLQREWKHAEPYFQKSIHFCKNKETKFFIYLLIGQMYGDENQVEYAENYLSKALSLAEDLSSSKNINKIQVYLSLSFVYLKKTNNKKALETINIAIKVWNIANSVQESLDNRTLFYIYDRKINILIAFFDETQNGSYLEEAKTLIPAAQKLINDTSVQIYQEEDRLKFYKYTNRFYKHVLRVLYELSALQKENQKELMEEIFYLSEKNKVSSLLLHIQKAESLELCAISSEKLQEIQQLQSKINHYQTLLQKTDMDSFEENFDFNAEQLANLQVEYHQLFQQIEQEHPEYLELKHQMPNISLSDLQSQLPHRTAAIAYTLTKEYVYIFCIHAQNISLQRIPLGADFHTQIDIFIGEGILGMNRKSFVQYAHQFYQLLIEPIEVSLQPYDIQSLLILPDNQLLEMPFEILLSEKTSFRANYRKMPFLLKRYQVHYHYSATLRQYQHNRKRSFKDLPPRLLGFAPVYDQEHFDSEESEQLQGEATRDVTIRGKNYKALLYSEEEVKNIQTHFWKKGWEAEAFLRQEANLSKFKEKIGELPAKYVHIAAHSVSNKQKNVLGLLFSPESVDSNITTDSSLVPTNAFNTREQSAASNSSILYAHELYQLQLKSDLVFLSCCESGIGKIAAGEGILSLNRGLLYAGVSNIVFTLFKIYDQKTAVFTQHFYDYLLNREDNYAAALHYAKLQLLEEGLPPRYWSGFLLLGD